MYLDYREIGHKRWREVEAWEQRQADEAELRAHWPASLDENQSVGSCETLSQAISQKETEEGTSVLLWCLHTCLCIPTHTRRWRMIEEHTPDIDPWPLYTHVHTGTHTSHMHHT